MLANETEVPILQEEVGMKFSPRRRTVRPAAILTLPIDPRLKEAIGKAADEAGLSMNEWVAQLAAEALGVPEYAEIPRKTFGRPRNPPAKTAAK